MQRESNYYTSENNRAIADNRKDNRGKEQTFETNEQEIQNDQQFRLDNQVNFFNGLETDEQRMNRDALRMKERVIDKDPELRNEGENVNLARELGQQKDQVETVVFQVERDVKLGRQIKDEITPDLVADYLSLDPNSENAGIKEQVNDLKEIVRDQVRQDSGTANKDREID